MNNRKSHMYVDGTAALKIDRSRSGSASNVVRLGRTQDGALVVDRERVRASRVSPRAAAPVFQEQPSLRDDLRIAFEAMGFKGMERNLFEGSSTSRTFTKMSVPSVVISSAVSFALMAFFVFA